MSTEKMRHEFEAWWDASGWKGHDAKPIAFEAWLQALSARGDEPVSATIRELVHDAAVTQNLQLATELSVYKDAFTRIQDEHPQPAPAAAVPDDVIAALDAAWKFCNEPGKASGREWFDACEKLKTVRMKIAAQAVQL